MFGRVRPTRAFRAATATAPARSTARSSTTALTLRRQAVHLSLHLVPVRSRNPLVRRVRQLYQHRPRRRSDELLRACSALYVKQGAKVTAGQKIAAVGTTGNSTGCHLHFGMHKNGSSVNPLNYVPRVTRSPSIPALNRLALLQIRLSAIYGVLSSE